MLRYVRNQSALKWIVIAAVVAILGTLAWNLAMDRSSGTQAAQQGVIDAQRDIAKGKHQFRIGGKPHLWFDETAAAFNERCGAELIRSHECSPGAAEWSYDSAYNRAMAAAMADRNGGFRFDDVYNKAVEEGRRRCEARLAGS